MKKEPMDLVAVKQYHEKCVIEVFQNSKTTHAVLTYIDPKLETMAKFHGTAVRSDDDDFNEDIGIDIAVARAKKAFHEAYINDLINVSKLLTSEINMHVDDLEFLTKKYGLNRKARDQKDNFKIPRFKMIRE